MMKDYNTWAIDENEKLETCPYHPAHTVTRKRLLKHLNKCEIQHPNHLIKRCMFNDLHRIHDSEYKMHIKRCPDRPRITKLMDLVAAPDGNEDEVKEENDDQRSEAYRESQVTEDDSWKFEGYDPMKKIQNSTLVTSFQCMTKSEKKEARHRRYLEVLAMKEAASTGHSSKDEAYVEEEPRNQEVDYTKPFERERSSEREESGNEYEGNDRSDTYEHANNYQEYSNKRQKLERGSSRSSDEQNYKRSYSRSSDEQISGRPYSRSSGEQSTGGSYKRSYKASYSRQDDRYSNNANGFDKRSNNHDNKRFKSNKYEHQVSYDDGYSSREDNKNKGQKSSNDKRTQGSSSKQYDDRYENKYGSRDGQQGSQKYEYDNYYNNGSNENVYSRRQYN